MKQLAKIKEVGFGCRDMATPCLWFTTELESGICALQVLGHKEAIELLKVQGIEEVHDLNGKMCWVEEDGMRVTFMYMWQGEKREEQADASK